MLIKEITNYLEELAPLSTQESYDNSGFICGDKSWTLTNALISLDCIEATVDEAIEKGCNLIISHHPIVFSGLKSLTGKTYIERTVIKAIKNDIAIYAIHTNLDNYHLGVNYKIGELLNIKNPTILNPKKNNLQKLSVFVPDTHKQEVLDVLFNSGAGSIGNYSDCSFSINGEGSFKANEDANPFVGAKNKRHLEKESKIEVIIPKHLNQKIISDMLTVHPYESVAYDLISLENYNSNLGSGMYGELENEIDTELFLKLIKKAFKTGCIKHTNIHKKKIKTIAWCGGSGSFLLNSAKRINADIFITGDFKYHEFFDAENEIIIADVGHFESEQFTIELIQEILSKKFTTFAPYLTNRQTNPVNYF